MVEDPVTQAFITAALFTLGIFVVMPLASRFIASDKKDRP